MADKKTVTVLKEVKPKKHAKVKMEIIKEEEKMKEAPGRTIKPIKINGWTRLGLHHGQTGYEVDVIHFYNKDGVVYKVDRLQTAHDICQIIFDKEIKMKQKPKFDGSVFFMRTKKTNIFGAREAELYVPIEYLEKIGYRVEREVKEAGYLRYIHEYLITPYFKELLRMDREEIDFTKRIDDLINLLKKSKSADEVPAFLQATLDIYNARAHKPISFGTKPREAK